MAADTTRVCAYCGAPLPGNARASTRFCRPAHRVAAAKRRAAGMPEERVEVVDIGEVFRELEEHEASNVADEELMSLEAVALELQRALRSRLTPPQAKGNLAREYRATLEAIERSRPPARDALGKLADELAAKRAQRGA